MPPSTHNNRLPPAANHESLDGAATRPILPAAAVASSDHHHDHDHDAAGPQRQRPTQKRASITPVACRPCQQRKHKCDGLRPVCSPCMVKKRADCCYDAAGDQRRTSALKQRIRDLTRQTSDLKAVIAGIGIAVDKDAATAIARQLDTDDFDAVADVAQAFRRDNVAADIFKGMRKDASRGNRCDAANLVMPQLSPASAAVADIQDLDGDDGEALALWPLDMAVDDGDLATTHYGNPEYQASAAFWPPGNTSVNSSYSHVNQAGPSGQTAAGARGADGDSVEMLDTFVPDADWYTRQ